MNPLGSVSRTVFTVRHGSGPPLSAVGFSAPDAIGPVTEATVPRCGPNPFDNVSKAASVVSARERISPNMASDSMPKRQLRRVVVTGAAGFIGCHLIERLVRDHASVVVGLDNERSGSWARLGVPCERIERDLAELSSDEFADICQGADAVFHLAAEKYNSSRSTPAKVIDVNIDATQRLFDAAARVDVGKVVFTSSLYAYGGLGPEPMSERDVPTPTTVYGMSKIAGEQLLRVAQRDHGFRRWSVARLFFVYGPRQYAEGGYKSVIVSNFERLARGEAPTVYGDGNQALDYVYIDDVVDALIRMVDERADGVTVNVSTGRALSINDLTQRMLAVSSSPLAPIFCPPDWTAGTVRVGDPALAEAQLGWRAATPMDDG